MSHETHEEPVRKYLTRREKLDSNPHDHSLRYAQVGYKSPRGYRARAHFGSADGGDWSGNERFY